jgi:hypothetical protein
MKREDVIRMAGEAGFNLHHNPELYDCMVANYKSIERFAALVAEAEREACAKACDEASLRFHALWEKFEYSEDQSMSIAASQCAAAIREMRQS